MNLLNPYRFSESSIYATAFLALSFRDLDTGLTGDHVWIKRTSDSAVNQFSLVSGSIDTAGIASWASGSACVLRRLYNQGTWNGYVEFDTDGNEPQIYDGSSFIMDNGNVAIYCATSRTMTGDWTGSETFPDDFSAFVVGRVLNAGGLIQHPTATGYQHFKRNFSNMQFRHNGTVGTFAQTTSGQQYLMACHRRLSADEIDFTFQGADIGTQTMDNSWSEAKITIGKTNSYFQEAIYFPEDLSADESTYLTEINGYYSAY